MFNYLITKTTQKLLEDEVRVGHLTFDQLNPFTRKQILNLYTQDANSFLASYSEQLKAIGDPIDLGETFVGHPSSNELDYADESHGI